MFFVHVFDKKDLLLLSPRKHKEMVLIVFVCSKPALRGADVVEAFVIFITHKLNECLAFLAMYIFFYM